VKISSDSVNEEFPAVVFRVKNALTLNGISDIVDNTINILSGEEISNLA